MNDWKSTPSFFDCWWPLQFLFFACFRWSVWGLFRVFIKPESVFAIVHRKLGNEESSDEIGHVGSVISVTHNSSRGNWSVHTTW